MQSLPLTSVDEALRPCDVGRERESLWEGQGQLASVRKAPVISPNLQRLIVLWAPDLGSVGHEGNALK